MLQATLTSQGQVTVPVVVRKKMGLKPGDKLTFFPDSSDWKELKVSKSLSFEELRGILKPFVKGKPRLTPARLEKLRVKMYTERFKRYLGQAEQNGKGGR